jgi:hypothetical protein
VFGVLMSEDGAVVVRGSEVGEDPEQTGRRLAARLREALRERLAAP